MDVDQQEVSALERKVGDQATTPLFARLAYLYLESGRAKDALRICDAGLANFPFYSTAHLIKGKALLHLGMNGEARREFEFVHAWLPTNPTVAGLLSSVPMTEDQVLEAPPTGQVGGEDAFGTVTPTTEEAASETPQSTEMPTAAAPDEAASPDASADDSTNVFGLPSEAPASGETAEAEQPDTGFGDEDAMAQFGGGGVSQGADQEQPPVGDFDTYAAQKQAELGPTGQTDLEEYLAAPPAQGEPQAEPETDFGGEDALAAAGFGGAVEAQPEDGAAMQEQEVQETGESPPAFEGFGGDELSPETEIAQPASEEPSAEAEQSGEDPFAAFSGGSQAGDDFGLSEEQPVATDEQAPQTEPAPASEPEPQPDASADSDVFAGFTEQTEQTEQAEEIPEPEPDGADAQPVAEAGESEFPDFSGMPTFEGPDQESEPEEPSAEPEAEPDAEGFQGPPPGEPEPPSPAPDRIEELTEKLQDAKKITPVIDLTSQVSSSSPSSADEAAVDAGFVTPTLAEIYAKQGWYDDAINAYKTLAKTRPAEKEKFEERVQELIEEKSKSG